jgi:anti-sigma B factor antagonist
LTASAEDFAVGVSDRGDIVVLAPQGRIDQTRAQEFQARLQPHLDACADHSNALILDLKGVDYISSVGLRVLMLAHKAARARNGTIVLCGPNPVVSEILRISAFDRVYRMESAVNGLSAA